MMEDQRPSGRHFAPRPTDDRGEGCEPKSGSERDCTQGQGSDQDHDAQRNRDIAIRDGQAVNHPKSQRRRIALRVALFVLMLVLLVAAGAAWYVNHSIGEGKRKFEESMQRVAEKSGTTIEHDGVTYRLSEHMVTVAFIGFDGRTTNSLTGDQTTGQSDTIMVLAFNTDTGKMSCIVIPRDSWVDVDTYVAGSYSGQQKMQICLQYTYGATNEESSQLVAQCASRVLSGMPIDYYFTLDIKGVGPLADAVGGVTLVPVQSVPHEGIQAGVETTLTGERAQEYVRYRDTDVDTSSIDRQERQVSFIRAFLAQVLASASGNPSVLIDLYQTALQYTWTNLGIDEFSYVASIVAQHGIGDFELLTLQGDLVEQNGHAAMMLDEESVTQTVLDVFYTRE